MSARMLKKPFGSSANKPVASKPYPVPTFCANSLLGCDTARSPPTVKREGKLTCALALETTTIELISTHAALNRIVSLPLGLEHCASMDGARPSLQRYIILR